MTRRRPRRAPPRRSGARPRYVTSGSCLPDAARCSPCMALTRRRPPCLAHPSDVDNDRPRLRNRPGRRPIFRSVRWKPPNGRNRSRATRTPLRPPFSSRNDVDADRRPDAFRVRCRNRTQGLKRGPGGGGGAIAGHEGARRRKRHENGQPALAWSWFRYRRWSPSRDGPSRACSFRSKRRSASADARTGMRPRRRSCKRPPSVALRLRLAPARKTNRVSAEVSDHQASPCGSAWRPS